VNMIRHHDGDALIRFLSIVVPTAFEHNGTHTLRKNPPVIGAECHEVLLVVALKMGELSTVESLQHGACGDSRPRLYSGAKLRSLEV